VIWNAFDSKSLIVKVDFLRNPMTDTIEKIIIKDEGNGIPFNKVSELFCGALGNHGKKKLRKKVIILYGQYGQSDLKPFH
jgi:hypothetical protein